MREEFKDQMVNLCFGIWVDVKAGDKLISTIRNESKARLEEILTTLLEEQQNMFREELNILLNYIIIQKSGLLSNETGYKV